MLTDSTGVIQGPYFNDLMAQPRALEGTYRWLFEPGRWQAVGEFLSNHRSRRIVLTGMGSSFHSLHPLCLSLIQSGRAPVMMETAELIHHGRRLIDERTLLIVVSQSGSSVEIRRLCELGADAALLAVTNTADSPLARRAQCTLLGQAGPEATVSCKTYTSGLLQLQWLAALAAGSTESDAARVLAPAASLVATYLAQWSAHCAALAARLRGTRHLFLAGRGASLAAVGTGALIIKESAHCHAEGMSSAALRHGPLEMIRLPGLRTVVLSGVAPTLDLNRQLLADLTARGGACDEIGEASSEPALRLPIADVALRPVLEILPIQMMTLALAALASREAGRFEQATKITMTE